MENKDYIKSLAAAEGITLKELAKRLSKKTGKKYTYASFRGKLIRNTFSYNEMKQILEILGYHIEILKNK